MNKGKYSNIKFNETKEKPKFYYNKEKLKKQVRKQMMEDVKKYDLLNPKYGDFREDFKDRKDNKNNNDKDIF